MFSFLVGNPWRSPQFVYSQTGGQTSGLHMNLRLLREPHFLRGLLQMCTPPQSISVLHSIYHTRCLVHNPPILVWLPNISPIPPYPPTLCSLYHPLIWLQTDESLYPPVLLYIILVVFFPSWHGCSWHWGISLSIFLCQKQLALI